MEKGTFGFYFIFDGDTAAAGTSFPGRYMATTTRLSNPSFRPRHLALGISVTPKMHIVPFEHHEPCRGPCPAQCPERQAASAVASATASPMASSQARFWTFTWLNSETCICRWAQTRSGQIFEAQEFTPQSQRSSAADKGYTSCGDSDALSKTWGGER